MGLHTWAFIAYQTDLLQKHKMAIIGGGCEYMRPEKLCKIVVTALQRS